MRRAPSCGTRWGPWDAQIAALEAECAQLDERLEKAAAEFPQTEERQMAEVMLQSATEENDRLKKELESFASGDAAVLETIRGGKENCHEAVNRWTDNTFLLKSWVEKKCGDRDQAAKFFKEHGVNFNNFDYWNDTVDGRSADATTRTTTRYYDHITYSGCSEKQDETDPRGRV